MQKMIYSPEDEQLLMTQIWSPHIKDDPLAFVLFAYPWGQQGTPLERFTGPRRWQRRVLIQLRDHIKANKGALSPAMLRKALASGRGIGKSALVSWLIHWMLSTRIGSSVIVSANSETQLRSITWGELIKWTAMAIHSHWWEPTATALVPANWLKTLVERDLKKGTRLWGAEGRLWSEENPDAYAGAHNYDGMMVIFDESSGIADGIWSVANGFFTEETPDRYWFAFSNPRRNTGYFYECFGARRDFWDTEQIDSRTVEGTDKSVYQAIIDEYGEDSDEARVEVYGQFPSQDDEQFIGPDLVDQAMARKRYNDMTAPVVIGVDPARSGTDSTVIVVRRGRDHIATRRFKGDDTMVVVGHVIDAIEDFNPVLTVVDEGGVGAGVVDRLKEQKYKVRGVNFGWKAKNPISYLNKRAEMWGAVKQWLKTGSLIKDKRTKTDLTGPKKKTDSSGAIQLESKKEMKARGVASPDDADALAVTFAFPVASPDTEGRQKTTRHNAQNGTMGSTSWMGS